MKKDGLEAELEELGRLMLEEGLTPWLAAKTMRARGVSSRGQSTLLYHAQRIVRNMPAPAFPGTEWALGRIAAGESVLVPTAEGQLLREALNTAGMVCSTRECKAIRFSPCNPTIDG